MLAPTNPDTAMIDPPVRIVARHKPPTIKPLMPTFITVFQSTLPKDVEILFEVVHNSCFIVCLISFVLSDA